MDSRKKSIRGLGQSSCLGILVVLRGMKLVHKNLDFLWAVLMTNTDDCSRFTQQSQTQIDTAPSVIRLSRHCFGGHCRSPQKSKSCSVRVAWPWTPGVTCLHTILHTNSLLIPSSNPSTYPSFCKPTGI